MFRVHTFGDLFTTPLKLLRYSAAPGAYSSPASSKRDDASSYLIICHDTSDLIGTLHSLGRMDCPPSQKSPASKVCHPATEPASTQIMFLYASSGPKSAIPLAFSIQGFHTTTSFKLSLVMEKMGLSSLADKTTIGTLGSNDWYTRSVSLLISTAGEVSVITAAFCVLST